MTKAFVLLLLCGAPALAQLPDARDAQIFAPELSISTISQDGLTLRLPTDRAPRAPALVHFYTFRKSWQAPPLRTNKEVFKSKVFVGSHALAFTAMGLACADRRTGESLHSELPAMIAVTAMDYLMFRFVSGFHGLIGSSYATQHYLRAKLK